MPMNISRRVFNVAVAPVPFVGVAAAKAKEWHIYGPTSCCQYDDVIYRKGHTIPCTIIPVQNKELFPVTEWEHCSQKAVLTRRFQVVPRSNVREHEWVGHYFNVGMKQYESKDDLSEDIDALIDMHTNISLAHKGEGVSSIKVFIMADDTIDNYFGVLIVTDVKDGAIPAWSDQSCVLPKIIPRKQRKILKST